MPEQEQQHLCYYCGTVNTTTSECCATCGSELILQQRYLLRRVLGQGGFGVVYEAVDMRLNRHCAIKRVTATSMEEQQVIQNEADILARHASNLGFIPTIYDTWVKQQQTYMVMEYIDGPSLDQTALPWKPVQVKEFLMPMLVNLARLHAVRIIHRDIKPQNIKYTPQGRHPYMLLDFGIARQGTAMSVKAMSPDYAPPEQVQGLSTDARSDIYGLAATAYHLLTDVSPLQARVQKAGQLPLPRQFAPDTPPQLEHALLHMLEPEPNNRPPHARAALALLGRAPDSAPAPIPVGRDSYVAQPTIPVDPRPSHSRRTSSRQQRTSYRTDEHALFDEMNNLSATFLDAPEAVRSIEPSERPPALWEEEFNKIRRGNLVHYLIMAVLVTLIALIPILLLLPFFLMAVRESLVLGVIVGAIIALLVAAIIKSLVKGKDK